MSLLLSDTFDFEEINDKAKNYLILSRGVEAESVIL